MSLVKLTVPIALAAAVGGYVYVRYLSTSNPSHATSQPAQETLWLSDFETEGEHAMRWFASGAYTERATEHATHGRYSAKVTFAPSAMASFLMADYLNRDPARGDWRRYEVLSFDLYNPQRQLGQLTLQLRNPGDRVYNEVLDIPAESAQHIDIPLRELAAALDLSQIVQINFFQNQPTYSSTFYLDALCLRSSSAPAPTVVVPSSSVQPTPAPMQASGPWRVAGWASGLVKLFRDPAAFQGNGSGPLQLSLARGEYESAQVALIGGGAPAKIKVSVGPLTHTDGATRIPNNMIDVRRVGYVTTEKPDYRVSYVGDWPDPLPTANEIEVPAGKLQPVWITVGAPSTLPAGRYDGTVTLTDGDGRTESLALQVTVWNFALPKTPHLKTAFDFYTARLRMAYEHFVPGGEDWTTQIDDLQQRYFDDMLKHRISPIWSANPTTPQFAWDITRYLDGGLTVFGVGPYGGNDDNRWPTDPVALEQMMVWYRQAAAELGRMQLFEVKWTETADPRWIAFLSEAARLLSRSIYAAGNHYLLCRTISPLTISGVNVVHPADFFSDRNS